MTLPEHAICSVMLAQFGVQQRFGWRGTLVVALAGISPDLDTVAKLFGDEHFWTLHHALGHNVFALVLLAAVISGLGRWVLGLRPWTYLFFWCMIAATAHAVTDCLYWFAVKPLWPLNDWALKWEILEYLDLIVLSIWLSAAICLWKWPQRGRLIATITLTLFSGYVLLRFATAPPTGVWKFITGGWMYDIPEGTPGFGWW